MSSSSSSTTNKIHLWLRDEVRPNERRTPITPDHAKYLLELPNSPFKITVEKSLQRIVPDESYAKVGCSLVDDHEWTKLNTSVEPKDETIFVLGLKELPNENQPVTNKSISVPRVLNQRHIYFAHCFKGQSDWKETLSRFNDSNGNGELLDLEFLQFDNGRRVAAFGRAAGFAGMAVGLLQWAQQQKHETEMLGKLQPFESKEKLIAHIKSELASVPNGKKPRTLVLGALGRCGQGSVELAKAVGIEDLIEWDLEETKKGGPFKELLDVDVLVNDIYLTIKIPPFLTMDMVKEANKTRKLTVFVDVSCDVGNPNNPFPLIDDITSFDKPSERVIQRKQDQQPLDVIAIDHLPTLVPLESSQDFGDDLLKHLENLTLVDFSKKPTKVHDESEGTEGSRVWTRARALFATKCEELENTKKNQ